MYLTNRQMFIAISTVIISIDISSCTQDSMIRVDIKSQLKLLPNTEIRYKACGETVDSCQQIFQSISSEKSKLIEIARLKHEERVAKFQEQLNKDSERCRLSSDVFGRQLIGSTCSIGGFQTAQVFDGYDEFYTPGQEDIKKIIKEVSNTNLSEYTYSKSDGSIVAICPTRYCAIASPDSGWIGIGERGKSIDDTSVVKAY